MRSSEPRYARSAVMRAVAVVAALTVPALALAQANRPVARTASYTVRAPTSAKTARAAGAAATLEIAVTGDGVFPARASDPVLHVGAVTLRKYRYTGAESRTLVFAVPADAQLDEGAPIYLRYEPSGDVRIDMGTFHAAVAP